MLVVLATTLAALGVVAIALVVYESRTYERSTPGGPKKAGNGAWS
jgi:hypothetical protein